MMISQKYFSNSIGVLLCLVGFLLGSSVVFERNLTADVKSTSGTILFDANNDQSSEMTLNDIGLGIGGTPSTNIHVFGNTIISGALSVGGSAGSSNLNINGTMGLSTSTVSDNVSSSSPIWANSMVFADTTSGNLSISLPNAENVPNRMYTIKKISRNYNLSVAAFPSIDGGQSVSITSMGYLSVLSDGNTWHVMAKDSSSSLNALVASSNLAVWNFTGISGAATANATTASTNVSTVLPVISRGSGHVADDYGNNTFGGYAIDKTTLTEAITANDYLSFTITPNVGQKMTIQSITFKAFSQNQTRSFALFSSVYGFTADKVLGTFISSSGTTATMDVGLVNITSAIEFRIYIYGSNDSWTNALLGEYDAHATSDDLVIYGSTYP
jgi:hypothetical protein